MGFVSLGCRLIFFSGKKKIKSKFLGLLLEITITQLDHRQKPMFRETNKDRRLANTY
jgi:hypothetical protein